LELFKGYVTTKNKKCTEKFKNVPASDLHTYEEVKDLPEFAGILAEQTILIDIDDKEQSEILMKIVEERQLDCRVYQTTRGRHFLFKNTDVDQCFTHVKIACGLTADIKVGCKNSYEILKFAGEERFIEWDVESGIEYQDVPYFLKPVKSKMEFLDMEAGEGRNSGLFGYELVLQSAGLSVDEARDTIKLVNQYVLSEPLADDELDVILRDEAFAKPVFYQGKAFLHNVFGQYLKSQFHVKRINGQLHVYDSGIYLSGYKMIESKMIEVIPNLKATQRTETLKYLEISTPKNEPASDAKFIAFRNGILNIRTMELLPFSPEYIITNIIPWDYNPNAYSELTDKTLDKIACNDSDIRKILEECIGYCFFRENELSKSFILTGTGANGKSTFLDLVEWVLGRENYVSLDLDELSEKFSTTTMFGKLANIGDDISDEFLQGKSISQFKKIVSGNDIKAENKGQDVYFFKPTVKLLFSANEIPRVRNKGFEAIKRRLVIIPFNAKFSKNDPDFNSRIKWDLQTQEVAEYLIQIGCKGLKRVLDTQGFTTSEVVQKELDSFERDNNPILLFLEEVEDFEILNHETKEVFARYDTFCHENGFTKVAMQTFSKEMKKYMNVHIEDKKIKGRKCRIFMAGEKKGR
jgi:putative DNA primase/helicase